MPVKKFKHGKWKMKWKKYYRHPAAKSGDEDRQANSEYRDGTVTTTIRQIVAD